MTEFDAPSAIQKVRALSSESGSSSIDNVVVEEPLEIRLRRGTIEEQLGITMRTPGADLQLAAGFLWGEGFLTKQSQLTSVKVCADRNLTPRQRANVVIAEVDESTPDFSRTLNRRFTMNSACGVCGATNISDLKERNIQKVATNHKPLSKLAEFADLLNDNQKIFKRTGGLHAAILVNPDDQVIWSFEDVGRHNAVDKVIGAALFDDAIPLSGWSLVVSGRIGYEIVQKAICAGISALVGVSAPTSLAIELAEEFNLTLVAFARNGKANQYLKLN